MNYVPSVRRGSSDSSDSDEGNTYTSRRKRMINAAATEDEEIAVFVDTSTPEKNNPYKSTTCMDQHVVARMEEDLRRAAIRESNPESRMPYRGQQYSDEIARTLDEYAATGVLPKKENNRKKPRFGRRAGSSDDSASTTPRTTPRASPSRATDSKLRKRNASGESDDLDIDAFIRQQKEKSKSPRPDSYRL